MAREKRKVAPCDRMVPAHIDTSCAPAKPTYQVMTLELLPSCTNPVFLDRSLISLIFVPSAKQSTATILPGMPC